MFTNVFSSTAKMATSENTLWCIFVALLLLISYRIKLKNQNALSVPRVGQAGGWFGLAKAKNDFIAHGSSLIENGYQKYKDSMFLIQTADMERIVLSNKYVDEIRTAPESILSVREGMCERHLGKYTTLDIIKTSHLQNDVCKGQLTQNLGKLTGRINEETCFGLENRIRLSQGVASLYGYELVLNVIAGVTSRVFVGLPTCRNEEWLQTAMGYTLDVFNVSKTLRAYHPLIRPFVAPFLDCTKRLHNHICIADKYLRPIVEQRLSMLTNEKLEDMIQWMLDLAQGSDRDPQQLAKKMLFLTLAAVHTSTMSTTHALFDLCAMPEYIKPLRAEIDEALKQEGGWTLGTINRLKQLDSFMKESQRMNHPGLLSFNRKVMAPLRLSDGTIIPEKSFITMATNSIARDPQYYPDPDKFDGFRFYRKRCSSASEMNRHQFVSTGPDSLPFGHGKFACPGRFFAAAQIKCALANILMNYDISYPHGQTSRPPNVFSGEGIGPSREQVIVFRQRNVES